jgi:luciferase family oxidoreductase group 1
MKLATVWGATFGVSVTSMFPRFVKKRYVGPAAVWAGRVTGNKNRIKGKSFLLGTDLSWYRATETKHRTSDLNISLSVLDQSPVPEGSSAGDALRNTIDLARLTDSLGYRRYWLAEHHGAASLACASPEAMIGPVADATSRIRVGSGGVMLPHYSPLKVAETFGMLASLYPDRIDLGIGRAAGTTPRVAHALQRDRRQMIPDDFRDQLDELREYFANARPGIPFRFDAPAVWLLGSSEQSAIWASELGMSYAFADFINPEGVSFARAYRDRVPAMAVAVSSI